MTTSLTSHAAIRMAQRAISDNDIELIMSLGREAGDGYIVLDKDCRLVETQLRRLIERVRSLRGKRIVVDGEKVLTTYRTSPRIQRRLLRTCEEREIE